MKKIFNFTLLITLLAATMVGCKPSTDVDGEKAYSVMVNIVLFENPTDADYQTKKELLEKKLGDAGLYNDGKFVTFNGTSPTAVGKTVSEKLKAVAREMADAPMDVRSALFAYGIESSLLGSAEKVELGGNFQLMAYEQTGTPENGLLAYVEGIPFSGEHNCRWVKSIDLGEIYESHPYSVGAGFSPLLCSILLTHSGVRGDDSAMFEWEDGVQYVTDVIGIYYDTIFDLATANPVVIEGRTYTARFFHETFYGDGQVCFYSTTDPVEGYEDYYLNTGFCHKTYGPCQCRGVMYDGLDTFMGSIVEKFNEEGHLFTERPIKGYNPDGTPHGEGVVDLGDNSKQFDELDLGMSFILTYAKR